MNLNRDIVSDNSKERPLTFYQRLETKICDASNSLQTVVDSVMDFTRQKQMKINSSKSCVMKICKSRTKIFPIEIKIGDEFLEVKKEMKILGVIPQPNLKWAANTAFICKKAYKTIWQIRRMKILGLDSFSILDYYMKEVRVHLELAVPVWHSGLTLKQAADIERVQHVAVGVMLGTVPYAQACATLGRHNDFFKLEKEVNPSSRSVAYREHFCRKKRFYKSPLPFLTRLLND